MGWLDERITARPVGHVAQYVRETIEEIDTFAAEMSEYTEKHGIPDDLRSRAQIALGVLEVDRALLSRLRQDSDEWGAVVERLETTILHATLQDAEARYQPGIPDRDVRQAIDDWETGGNLEWVLFRRYTMVQPWWDLNDSAARGLTAWAHDVEALNRLHEEFHEAGCWWQFGVYQQGIADLPKDIRGWLSNKHTKQEVYDSIREDVKREWNNEAESYGWLQDFGTLQDRGTARYEWILNWLQSAPVGEVTAKMLQLTSEWEECETIFRGFHDADLESELAQFDARISASQSSRLIASVKDATVNAFLPSSTLVFWGLPAARGAEEPTMAEKEAFEQFEYRMAVYVQSPRRLLERFAPNLGSEETAALGNLELWYEAYLQWQAKSLNECYTRRIERIQGQLPAA